MYKYVNKATLLQYMIFYYSNYCKDVIKNFKRIKSLKIFKLVMSNLTEKVVLKNRSIF